jgi:hypothetical protein
MPVCGIPDDIVQKVRLQARRGQDPLRILKDRREPGFGMGTMQTVRGDWIADPRARSPIADAVDAGLRGLDDAARARVSRSLITLMGDVSLGPVGPPSDMDAVLARLLAHLGVDPLMTAWLARVASGAVVNVNHPSGFVSPLALLTQGMGSAFEFHRHVHWQPDGIVTLRMRSDLNTEGLDQIPETVAAAAVGQPLSALVSHPVLDALAPTIAFVERDDFVKTSPGLLVGTAPPPKADMALLLELSGRLHARTCD